MIAKQFSRQHYLPHIKDMYYNTELFYTIVFPCFLLLCYPYILLQFKCFSVCLCRFFSSRYMLELKFAIYHRTSLSSQASSVDGCSIRWRITDPGICSKTESTMAEWMTSLSLSPCTPNVFLIQQQLSFVAKCIVRVNTMKKMASQWSHG